ncbi:hypothetical protein ESA_01816 [Cronobacter sakazakii ATCC BAA-894]|uniref:Uncharacterized protein n=1 Tax=Cronobacter sakazakii (strain ATCC BAA-894) TaxID=290339 RepID=A7MPS0_CROS8|nr:hypothetical protein ESA_01816 [Cronobacter sakazakii ATCC BAA-894]
MQAKVRQLAAKTALLHAAKRHAGVTCAVAVNKDAAALQTRREILRAGIIGGPDGRAQAKFALVRQLQRLFGVARHANGCHRPEQLLAKRGHLARHVAKHRRRVEIRRTGYLLATQQQRRAFAERRRHLRMQLVTQIKTRHRAQERGFVGRRAHFQLLRGGHEFFGKGIGDAGFDDKTLGGSAHLPGVLVAPRHRRFHGLVEIGVRQHDERIGTAQLQHAFFQRRARLRADCGTRTHAAGDGNGGDTRIVNRLAHPVVGGVNHLEHAGRHARVFKNLINQQRAAHHVRRMLKQISVARQQDRYRAAHHLPQREVPRHNGQDRSERTVFNHRLLVFHQRRLRREHRRAMFGVPVAERGGFRHFAARLKDRLAHLGGDHLRQLFAACAQCIADVTQRLRAFINTAGAPAAKAFAYAGNSQLDLFSACQRVRRQGFAGGRIYGNRMGRRGNAHQWPLSYRLLSVTLFYTKHVKTSGIAWPALVFLKSE